MAQFPLGMGQGGYKGKSEGQMMLQYDAEGKLRHDAVARVGHTKDKVFFSVFMYNFNYLAGRLL